MDAAVADASFISALIDLYHPENYRCRAVYERYEKIYATTNTFAEVLSQLRNAKGEAAEIEFVRNLNRYRLQPARLEWADIARARELAQKYGTGDILAAVKIALAERLQVITMLTLERSRYAQSNLVLAPPKFQTRQTEYSFIYVFVDTVDDSRSAFVEKIAEYMPPPGHISSTEMSQHICQFDDPYFSLSFMSIRQNGLSEPHVLEIFLDSINEGNYTLGCIWLIENSTLTGELTADKNFINLNSSLTKPMVIAINKMAEVDESKLQIPASYRVVHYDPDDKESIKNVLLVLCDEVLKDIEF